MSAPGKEATLSLHAAQKIADVQKNINDLIKDKKKINKHYMLFLFKIYDSEDGIQKCCEENDLKQELLNFYIQK